MDANTQITQLQQEIALRGRIIEALLTGNEELRLNYARAISFIRSKTDTYSHEEKEMLQKMLGNPLNDSGKGITERDLLISENSKGITNASYSIDENGKGITKESLSIDENRKGTTNASYSFDENGKGITKESLSIDKNGKGITKESLSIDENRKGITNASYSLDEKNNGITSPDYSIFGKTEQQKLSVSALHQQVRQHHSHKAKRSALWAATELLIHIYNGGHCGYPALKKVTKLSTGGLSKMLMRLTKRGLIKRTGLQKLELTASALSMLNRAQTSKAQQ